MQDIPNWLTFIHYIAQIIFFIAASIAASFGIRKWWKELTGKSKYQLALDIITYSHRIKDAIEFCQGYPRSKFSGFKTSDPYDLWNDRIKFVKNRFPNVLEIKDELYPIFLKSQAVFKKEEIEAIEKIFNSVKYFQIAINNYESNSEILKEHKEFEKAINDENEPDGKDGINDIKEELKTLGNIIYGRNNYGLDPTKYVDYNFRIELIDAVKLIDTKFKKYIK